jgi:asparagine synthase (glutamine-hydrolysing)
MCGITGFLDGAGQDEEQLRAMVHRMAQTLVHRGPDAGGAWVDAAFGVALGHRRLAVLDLSEHGHQPMLSPCGNLCLVYNGEIYNHKTLRRELEGLGHRFRGHGDTEVLLAAIRQWGVRETLPRLVGMFAFAVWDRERQVLTLARDRIGIKPLYYGWQRGGFLFGSELKSLKAHPKFCGEIDHHAAALFLRHNYIPAPYSIYRGIRKLPPGTMLSVTAKTPSTVEPEIWWSLQAAVEQGLRRPFAGPPEEAVGELDRILREAVASEMEADVPLGAFLSGGIDSSTVVAMMQAQSSRPVKTFTVAFEDANYNEADWARAVAEHLGAEHTELQVTAAEAREQIPSLCAYYDEPFADSSQIPTLLLAKLTRRHVTVSLSGDGGDELFCGYDRYFYLRKLWRRVAWCPARLRQAGARLASAVANVNPSSAAARRLQTLAEFLLPRSAGEFYRRFNAHWRDPAQVLLHGDSAEIRPDDLRVETELPKPLEEMMFWDARVYLPDDLLVKLDRASMAVGLEARVPLLDHRVVEFAWTLPLSLKVREGQTKWVLRRVLERYLPRAWMERPKMGFAVPLDAWLRGPLRAWAEDLLDERRLRREAFFRPEPIRQKWEQHLSGRCNWQYLLWDVLVLQTWLEANRD